MHLARRVLLLILVYGAALTSTPGLYGFEEVDEDKKTSRIFDQPANAVAPQPPSQFPKETKYSDNGRDDEEPRYISDSFGDSLAMEKTSRHTNFIDVPLKFSGAIGFVQESFFAKLTATYPLYEQYLGVDTSAYYLSDQDRHIQRHSYGAEVALAARLVNPTIFMPFVGAGPGYEQWSFHKDGENFDKSQAMIASYYWGVLASFTKHFGLTVSRRLKYYLTDTPLEEDGHTKADNPLASIEAGFTLMF